MNVKTKRNSVWATVVVLGFITFGVIGCNKYDKMSILGTWEIDLKEALKLNVDSSKEVLYFVSGSDQTYKQTFNQRTGSKWERWSITGQYERKNNKITFINRVKDPEGAAVQQGNETYKYRIEGDKLIFIVEGQNFDKDEKVYRKR
jgi:hypothetical protein